MSTREAFEIAAASKHVDNRNLTVAGGGNARALHERFLHNGFDVVVFGEGETTIVDLCRASETNGDLSRVRGIAFKSKHGDIVVTAPRPVESQLDRLPVPAWDLLPLDKYWELGDPPGGPSRPGPGPLHDHADLQGLPLSLLLLSYLTPRPTPPRSG